ncbi:hypothetical protein GCM10009779_34730 [Polymorphospora rubra]|uniref:Uncharacterized protein n=1 Tax=Polymorphospora rubra TaxID=338584 RepID=A0A810NEQ7_9ACTN|nr:hypothetical protein Prubr_73990 [Polymorphospora rubra]
MSGKSSDGCPGLPVDRSCVLPATGRWWLSARAAGRKDHFRGRIRVASENDPARETRSGNTPECFGRTFTHKGSAEKGRPAESFERYEAELAGHRAAFAADEAVYPLTWPSRDKRPAHDLDCRGFAPGAGKVSGVSIDSELVNHPGMNGRGASR